MNATFKEERRGDPFTTRRQRKTNQKKISLTTKRRDRDFQGGRGGLHGVARKRVGKEKNEKQRLLKKNTRAEVIDKWTRRPRVPRNAGGDDELSSRRSDSIPYRPDWWSRSTGNPCQLLQNLGGRRSFISPLFWGRGKGRKNLED